MREIPYGFSGYTVKTENEREQVLVGVFNTECERIVKYWLTDADWAERFETFEENYWMFQDLHGLARAMYFMDFFVDVNMNTAHYIYNFIKAEVERRKNEADTSSVAKGTGSDAS